MEIENLLSKIGLNKKESRIYTTLLESGAMTIAGISQNSGVNRPAIYKIIPNLQKQGLVTMTTHGKQKRYLAESPHKLKILVDNLKDLLYLSLPELESVYEAKGYRPIVKFFKGKEGIKQVFMDVVNCLERKATYYRYTASLDLKKIDKYIPRDFRIIRDRKELEAVIISSSDATKQKWVGPNRVIKEMPPEFDLFDYEVSMLIYSDKIAFIDFNTEMAVIIENKKIAEFQRKLFQFIYRKI